MCYSSCRGRGVRPTYPSILSFHHWIVRAQVNSNFIEISHLVEHKEKNGGILNDINDIMNYKPIVNIPILTKLGLMEAIPGAYFPSCRMEKYI
jgi:hypothetical protein